MGRNLLSLFLSRSTDSDAIGFGQLIAGKNLRTILAEFAGWRSAGLVSSFRQNLNRAKEEE
jgi:hypothetical protein